MTRWLTFPLFLLFSALSTSGAEASLIQEFLKNPRQCLVDALRGSPSSTQGVSKSPSSPINPALPLQANPLTYPALPDRELNAPSRDFLELLTQRSQETQTLRLAHERHQDEIRSIVKTIPIGTLDHHFTLRLQFESVLRHAPQEHRKILVAAQEALLHQESPAIRRELEDYLQTVLEEAKLLASQSPSVEIRGSVFAGNLPTEPYFEKALIRRIQAQGFPPPVTLNHFLPKDEFRKWIANAPAFIDEVDISVAALKAGGNIPSDQPVHGRLSHLAALDYVATHLRSKGLSPTSLRETLLWAGSRDPITTTAVWGYLFDQAPQNAGGRGLSSPDIFHQVLEKSWNLSR